MALKQTLNPFNRFVGNIELVDLLRTSPLDTVTFVSTLADIDLVKYSGAVTRAELEADLGAGPLVEKILVSLNQLTVGGAPIKPVDFFVCGQTFVDQATFEGFINAQLYEIVSNQQKFYTNLVYDDITALDAAGIIALDGIVRDWYCTQMFVGNDLITQAIVDDTNRSMFIYPYQTGALTFELYQDAATAGRVVYMGVGNTQGVAKELVGATAYEPSFVGGEEEDGKLSATEAQVILDEGYNLYTKHVSSFNETTGVVFPDGNDFTEIWALYKVRADLEAICTQLRHNSEVLTTSPTDEFTVRQAIVSGMDRLAAVVFDEDGNVSQQAIIFDYRVTKVNLDRSLEENKGKFAYRVEVSLQQEAKWFEMDIIGFRDGRSFEVSAESL